MEKVKLERASRVLRWLYIVDAYVHVLTRGCSYSTALSRKLSNSRTPAFYFTRVLSPRLTAPGQILEIIFERPKGLHPRQLFFININYKTFAFIFIQGRSRFTEERFYDLRDYFLIDLFCKVFRHT